jgi:multidrug efflux system outer membrane protein
MSQPGPVPLAAPAAWQAPLPHNGELTDLSRWWQDLGNPLLVEFIDAAQQVSPSLASTRSRVIQSRAALRQTQARLGPTLDGTAGANRGVTHPATPVASTLQAGVLASWEIDLFGANRLGSEAAQARLDGARALWHDARVVVATEARYQGGLASLVELEDARRTRLASADALVSLRLERIQAWIALYRAAGGGWKALAADEQS